MTAAVQRERVRRRDVHRAALLAQACRSAVQPLHEGCLRRQLAQLQARCRWRLLAGLLQTGADSAREEASEVEEASAVTEAWVQAAVGEEREALQRYRHQLAEQRMRRDRIGRAHVERHHRSHLSSGPVPEFDLTDFEWDEHWTPEDEHEQLSWAGAGR